MENSMKTKIASIIGSILCLSIALSAMQIHNDCENKEKTVKTESGVYNEDYLYLGDELDFFGSAEDLVFLGKRLNFDGTTKLGLIAFCEKLFFSGSSGNGIIAGGMDVHINGSIANNSYVGCKSLTLSETSTVNGNLFVGCAKLLIDGKMKGDLYAGAGEIIINNEIEGNATIYAGRLIIGKKGKINGNLTYSTKEKLSVEELARVTGIVKIDEKHKGNEDWNEFINFLKTFKYLLCFGLFVSCLVVGFLLLFVPAFKKLGAPQSSKTFWSTALWGLIPVLMYPAVIVLCFALIITIPFALILMLACVPLFFIAWIIGTTLTGKYLVTKLKWPVEKRHFQFLIGALASIIISWIPIINCLSMLFIVALGWGVFLSFLFTKDLTVKEANQSN